MNMYNSFVELFKSTDPGEFRAPTSSLNLSGESANNHSNPSSVIFRYIKLPQIPVLDMVM
jgi:hypothetical protein